MSERYLPNAEQTALAASVSASLASMLPLSRLHRSYEESAQSWAALRALGVFGISLPQEQGGGELGATEEALIMVELGRRVVTPSVFATAAAAHLPRAAKGVLPAAELCVAAGYRRGERVFVVEEAAANAVLVRDGAGASLCALPSATRAVDERLWSCRLLEATRLGEALAEATPAQLLRVRLIDAAALAGVARAALDMAVGYAAMREQFGRVIGSFQAVKHHCANMALAARAAADQVSFAAVALDERRDDARLHIECACYVAGSAALDNCGKNIQIHGGIGFSDEADPQRLLKRARVLVEIGGGLDAALSRIGDCPVLF